MSSIAELLSELEAATSRARSLIETTDGRLFTVRPDSLRWSAAECLAHLTLTSEKFIPVLRTAIEDGRKRGLTSTAAPKMDLVGRFMRWFLEPPMRSRVKTAAPFVPRSTRAKAEAFAEFAARQTEIAALLGEAKDLDLSSIKIVSPFDSRVKYNLYSAFKIITAHERRHLWQAERTLEEVALTREAYGEEAASA